VTRKPPNGSSSLAHNCFFLPFYANGAGALRFWKKRFATAPLAFAGLNFVSHGISLNV
jgi:hypothetical protein